MIKHIAILLLAVSAFAQDFIQRPYLQLGNQRGALALLWHAQDADAPWQVEYKSASASWTKASIAVSHRVDVRGVRPHRVYEASLAELSPGKSFDYRVRFGEREVFASSGIAPRASMEPHTFAVIGDTGNGSTGQRRLAVEIAKAKPEYMAIVGDIVYMSGLIAQYNRNYFPVYNCEPGTTAPCASLLRSTTTMAIPGNHDIHDVVRLGWQPGSMAYFYYWSQPLNGPLTDNRSLNLPKITGNEKTKDAFFARAKNFPQMAMYSFDWGGVHWLMLDSNAYVDWSDPRLVEWVRKDLAAAKNARWRFVGQHHPAFSSASTHGSDQWMRQLAPTFEQGGVDIVWAGHVHNYQRSRPLKFRPTTAGGQVKKIQGEFTIDKDFDGVTKTTPKGVLWVVTGAGGASLKEGNKDNDPSKWQPFTVKFHGSTHSFSLVDATADRLTIRQVDATGREIDRFAVTR